MEIKKIDKDEAKIIFKERMEYDFPEDELRPFFSIESLIESGNYICCGFYEGEKLLCYAYFATKNGYALLDYFAVSKELRGAGIGGSFFEKFKERPEIVGAPYVIIEVESVSSAKGEEEENIRKRRISFYEKCGCKMSGVKSLLFGVEYSIMYLSFDGGQIPDRELSEKLSSLYRLLVSQLVNSEEEYNQKARIFSPKI